MWKWSHHYAIVEAVEPFKLHPTSMSYIYKVFEHLKQLWMGIWQHTHTITATEVCQDLGEFTEILDDVSVEIIPVHYHWGCRTFQTASHIYVIHILGVWTLWTVACILDVLPGGILEWCVRVPHKNNRRHVDGSGPVHIDVVYLGSFLVIL